MLKYFNNGVSNISNPTQIYICCHQDDKKLYLEQIKDDITRIYNNCIVFYNDDDELDQEEIQDLRQMQVMITVVTSRFLDTENTARNKELEFALKNKMPIIPILMEKNLEKNFNKICAPIHCINKKDDLKKALDRMIINDEMIKKIQDAFDAYIFLSYRKKDKKYAKELRKLIHKNPMFQDIAVWYDDNLVAGDRFDDVIKKALETSKIFTLLVTPNLIQDKEENKKNYVMEKEYPEAVKNNIPIIPVEFQETDKNKLKSKFENIPECIKSNEEEKLNESLINHLKEIAIHENNNPNHNFLIGLAYLKGIDVEVDIIKALKLITSSSEQGYDYAQNYLGNMYFNGEGVEQDFYKAVCWYEKSAKQGYNEAQFNLAVMYYNGLGVEQDYERAIKWYEKSADQGYHGAQVNLGNIYADGIGVEQDYKQAIKWYKKSAEQGNSVAQLNLGIMYAKSEGVKQDYETAMKWYKKSAEQGNSDGQYSIGVMYANGDGVEKNYTQAMNWFKKAANQGNNIAEYSLAVMYLNGDGVEKNYKKAIEWLKKSAEQDNSNAQYKLGNMYYQGIGTQQDYKQAMKWYEKAAEQGNSDAQLNLGCIYANGEEVEQDYEKAKYWFEKAANQGNDNAQQNLNMLEQN